MRKQAIQTIYTIFENWAAQLDIACRKGCSTCCTQDVTMCAPEGDIIIDFIRENFMEEWLCEKLAGELPPSGPTITTNEYAFACLNGQERDAGFGSFDKKCPFLDRNVCSIYEVRPFSCRCFISFQTCSPGQSAIVPQHFMSASTAVSQIIEHLGQKLYWGNMLHVLYLLSQSSTKGMTEIPANNARCTHAQTQCLTAKPLPGFLIGEDDYPLVVPLLEEIFEEEVNGRKIEDILNNR